MNKIDEMFKNLIKNKKTGIFPFIPAGYPNIETTERLIYKLVDLSVDLIEIGVPFSDPIADGVVIQNASNIALNNGINLTKIFEMIKRLRKNNVKIPLVLMSYFNPILKFGIEKVAKISKDVGVDGFIIPDLLPFSDENSQNFTKILKQNNLHQIFLASIITDDARLEKIVKNTTGFLYLISKLGVTGVSKNLQIEPIKQKIKQIKKIKNIPVALGFGISNKEQIMQINGLVEGVIIGSAITKLIDEKDDKKVVEFIRGLR